jgi:hypothetical protein
MHQDRFFCKERYREREIKERKAKKGRRDRR